MIPGHERPLWQQTMQGPAETGVGTKSNAVVHAVKMAFWQVYSVIHFKSCIHQSCGVSGFWIKSAIGWS